MSGISDLGCENKRSIESQIDRLNERINDFMNKSVHSHKNSVFSQDIFESLNPKLQENEYLLEKNSKFSNPDSLLTQFSQVCMKLEDISSNSLREFNSKNLPLLSELRSNSSESLNVDLEGKEIHIGDLYKLEKQVKNIINLVESGKTFSGSVKFCEVTFFFHVFGVELENKDKLMQLMFPEEYQWTVEQEKMSNEILNLRKTQALGQNNLSDFMLDLEKCMYNSFETLDLEEKTWKNSESDLFDKKSWALLQVNYSKLKVHHKKCEIFSKGLEWQSAETQTLNNHLKEKLKSVLKKEGEADFRIQELAKSEARLQETSKLLTEKEHNIVSEQSQLEESKKKLEKMKNLINLKIDELNKSTVPSIEQKRTHYTSRVTDYSPTQKTLKSPSALGTNSSNESSQNFEISGDSTEDPKPSNKAYKAESFTTKSFKDPPKSCNRSTFTARNTVKLPRNNKDSYYETPKPPVYRASMRIITDPNSSLALNKSIMMREERVAEKECEIEIREKEIHDHWRKHPNAQEFIPMIQNEMIRLRSMQEIYDFKLKDLQMRIEEYDLENSYSQHKADLSQSSQELSVHAEKLKDLYSMMEEMFL